MENMTIKRAARLCGGTLYGCRDEEQILEQCPLKRIVIDSRRISEGDLFAAFRGERADGHDYIAAAFSNGAACCLVDHVPEGQGGPLIVVQNVGAALEKIAAGCREEFDFPVVGITGSVGKTTAKEMISSVLQTHFNTFKTEGNLNNQIGVPMMLSRIGRNHQAAVIEMGISGFGEMRSLAKIVRPTIAVFTLIGHAHLEFLGDLDGVLKAKSEMLEYMPVTSPVIVNGDDEKLLELSCRQRKITCGFGRQCDLRADNMVEQDGMTCCEFVCGMRRISVRIPAVGKHHVYAALFAAAVGMLLGLSDQEIEEGIQNFRNVARRGELIHTDDFTIIDDSYNANPDSVKSGIDTLLGINGKRHVCLLGDMLELGEHTLEMHAEVGHYALEKGADLVLTSGEYAAEMSRGAGAIGRHFESKDKLIEALPLLLKEGDCILVKASKGSHFETVSSALKSLHPLESDKAN